MKNNEYTRCTLIMLQDVIISEKYQVKKNQRFEALKCNKGYLIEMKDEKVAVAPFDQENKIYKIEK